MRGPGRGVAVGKLAPQASSGYTDHRYLGGRKLGSAGRNWRKPTHELNDHKGGRFGELGTLPYVCGAPRQSLFLWPDWRYPRSATVIQSKETGYMIVAVETEIP